MLVKRILLVVISFALGAGITAGILATPFVGSSIAEYGSTYFFFTSLCIGIAIGIWLDKFMNTEILPK